MATPYVPVTPKEKHQQDACTGVATAFTIVSLFVVVARIYTRTNIVHNVGKDDWTMLMALVVTGAYLASIYVLRDNGMGFHGTRLSLGQMERLIQTTLGIEVLYYMIVFLVKLSICFSYLRIAVVKSFERLTKATIYFLSIFCFVCIIVTLGQCRPLHKMWDLTGMVRGTCINSTAYFYSTSAINIVTDIWIIALPIPTLLRIQRPASEKYGLIVVFSLGIFSCIASIVRLHSIRIYTQSKDPFYDSVPVNLWSMVEVNIGIWCASIPALKALMGFKSRVGSHARSREYQYHSTDRSGDMRGNAKGFGYGSGSTEHAGASVGLQSFDLVVNDAGRVVKAGRQGAAGGEVQVPQRVLTDQRDMRSGGGGDENQWRGQSDARFFSPGPEGRV